MHMLNVRLNSGIRSDGRFLTCGEMRTAFWNLQILFRRGNFSVSDSLLLEYIDVTVTGLSRHVIFSYLPVVYMRFIIDAGR